MTGTNLEDLPCLQVISELNNIPRLTASDPDSNMPSKVNFDYYSVSDFINSTDIQNSNLPKSSFSVLNCNIRSLNANFDHLIQMLADLSFPFSFIGLTETWINAYSDHSMVCHLPGYTFISQPTKLRAGGVGAFIHYGINFHIRDDLSSSTDEYEMLWIEIENKSSKNTLCGIIYRHPNSNLDLFSNKLFSNIEIINREGKLCALLGDFNINLLNFEIHKPTEEFINTMSANFYEPHIIKPTRITHHTATLIDNIFFNSLDFHTISGNIIYDLTDHLPNFLIINEINILSDSKDKIYKQDYSNLNEEFVLNDFALIQWQDAFRESQNVNQLFEVFFSECSRIVNKHLPLKKLSRKEVKFNSKPWITRALQKSIKHKDILYRQFLRTKSSHSHFKYKIYRNKLVGVLRLSKKLYYRNYFITNQSNVKNVWKGIRQLVSLRSKDSFKPNRLVKDNQEITDVKSIANEFNCYFATIGSRLATEIPSCGAFAHKLYLDNPSSSSFFLSPVTNIEIIDIISTLNSNKATGPYSIPIVLLKILKNYISHPLEILFNCSFTTGTVPDHFKMAKVIPVFKKGSPLTVSNYRPISLLSIFNKILERLMYNRLIMYFEKSCTFFDQQFGFRSNHSTVHALILMVDKIQKAIDNKNYSCGVFIDLCKAFDTVDHHILLDKLEYYGIRGIAHKWFSSYLSNRSQFVSLGQIESGPQQILCGVPQGSVLGPLLFLLYVNDLHKCSNLLDFHLFADDTNIFLQDQNLKSLELKLNEELDKVNQWLQSNRLSLNIDKTNFVIFHPPQRKTQPVSLKISDRPVEQMTYVKYLGLIIDCHLNWKKHAHEVSKKISRGIGILSKLRHFVTNDILTQLYYSLVYPFLTYGLIVWGNTYTTTLKPIVILQKKAVRIITFSKRDAHSSPLFSQLGLIKFMDLVSIQTALFMFQYHHTLLPKAFDNFFLSISSKHNYNTRLASKSTYYINRVRTNYGKFNLHFSGPSIWNNLDEELKSLSLHSFKQTMKKRYVSTYG